jgi:hypothetical protein
MQTGHNCPRRGYALLDLEVHDLFMGVCDEQTSSIRNQSMAVRHFDPGSLDRSTLAGWPHYIAITDQVLPSKAEPLRHRTRWLVGR